MTQIQKWQFHADAMKNFAEAATINGLTGKEKGALTEEFEYHCGELDNREEGNFRRYLYDKLNETAFNYLKREGFLNRTDQSGDIVDIRRGKEYDPWRAAAASVLDFMRGAEVEGVSEVGVKIGSAYRDAVSGLSASDKRKVEAHLFDNPKIKINAATQQALFKHLDSNDLLGWKAEALDFMAFAKELQRGGIDWREKDQLANEYDRRFGDLEPHERRQFHDELFGNSGLDPDVKRVLKDYLHGHGQAPGWQERANQFVDFVIDKERGGISSWEGREIGDKYRDLTRDLTANEKRSVERHLFDNPNVTIGASARKAIFENLDSNDLVGWKAEALDFLEYVAGLERDGIQWYEESTLAREFSSRYDDLSPSDQREFAAYLFDDKQLSRGARSAIRKNLHSYLRDYTIGHAIHDIIDTGRILFG